MSAWHSTSLRTATAVGLAMGMALTATGTASADPDPAYDWGTVVETKDGVQSNAWVIGVTGVGRIVNARLFESASPSTPKAPRKHEGGRELVNLAPGGIGLGKVSALYSTALTNEQPKTKSSKLTIPYPGSAYANAGGASVDIGVPYIEPQSPEGTQLSGIGVHVDAIDVHARSLPGKSVEFQGGAASGYLSIAGVRIIDIPPIWAVNLGVKIPAAGDNPSPVIATTNEQVTTDEKGVPTKGKDGSYKYDPKATSGYVTGIHASVLGPDVADITIAHAAVIRDRAKTDMLKPPAIKLPGLLDLIINGGKKPTAVPDLTKPAETIKPPAEITTN
ncbi:hypothetical protein P8605_08145 [Streptomyces sp. T-3]|nr:hypothetical protein [Streptomyces sp. T-3]